MDQDTRKIFEPFLSSGVSRSLPANCPELIYDANEIWLVEKGSVDLFLVQTDRGHQYGARYPLFRADAGELVLPMTDLRAPWRVMAAGIPNTCICRMQWVDLTLSEEITAALSNWLRKSMAALKAGTPKGVCMELVMGSQPTSNLQPACYSGQLSWFVIKDGQAKLWDLMTLSPDMGTLPIAKGFWFNSLEPSVVELTGTESAATGAILKPIFRRYHRCVCERYIDLIGLQTEAEKERLKNRRLWDEQILRRSLTAMLGILEGDQAERLERGHDFSLFMACEWVAAEQGIDLKLPHNAELPVRELMQAIARASKIRMREVVLADRWWLTDNGPLLAFVEADERAVALCLRGRRYVVKDSATGIQSIVDETVAESLSPVAYSFYRTLPTDPLSAGDIYHFARFGLNRDIAMVLLMGLAGGLLGLLPPIAMGILVDTIIPGAERIQLIQLTLALIAFGLGNAMFSITRAVAMVRIESRMDSSLQAAVWDRILSLPVPFFRDFSAGDLAARAMGINTIRQILSGTTTSTLIASIFSVFNLAMMFYYSWELALTGCLLVLISAAVTMTVGYYSLQYQRQITAIQGKVAGTVLQLLKAIPKLRGSGSERRAFGKWAENFIEQREKAYKAKKLESWVATTSAVLPLISSITIFSVVMFMLDPQASSLSTGQFLAFSAAFGVFLSAVLQTAGTIIQVVNIIPIYERAKPILQAVPEIDERKADPGILGGDIEVNQAYFRYHEDGPDILKNVNIKARPGEFVALVGASGSGKSTLLRLLLGFEQLGSGAIYYDAKNLADLDLRSVRQQIGVVLQSGKLTVGEIYTNIVGSRPLTIDDAWEAARMAGLEKDIKAMPMGMHTLVSEGSGTLSGGQRQRLLIARALVNKPRIIFFDEATSALDNPTQAQVSASLERLQATRIVIAHRLSTIRNADRIYVLEAGQVVEEGDYDSLLKLNGRFAEMARRQLA